MGVIVAESLHKVYRSGFLGRRQNHALRGVSLSVEEGEIFGLLGTNGAGKTTLLNIFSCQLLPDSGRASVLGYDLSGRVPNELKARINMCSGSPNFPWSLSVEVGICLHSYLPARSPPAFCR